ncbi:hypothetical protein Rhe02_57370 [Rhizocola hellebori]|uniref:Secreted protein n=1 Tax=Rhizocola hellebori TaxID=1392758 RepID=A0A8J3QDK7_9ACTN|nr:hypothetical protein [Rhizocola hellebori]GIH07670.1 hypothetical protein Rhe02_57370 [Rhizocola hellebori]
MRTLRMALIAFLVGVGMLAIPAAAQAAPGDQSTVCGIGAPSGSVIIYYTYSGACYTPPGAVYNASRVMQVNGYPIGTNVTACSGSPVPAGWAVVYSGFMLTGCSLNYGYPGYGMVLTRQS